MWEPVRLRSLCLDCHFATHRRGSRRAVAADWVLAALAVAILAAGCSEAPEDGIAPPAPDPGTVTVSITAHPDIVDALPDIVDSVTANHALREDAGITAYELPDNLPWYANYRTFTVELTRETTTRERWSEGYGFTETETTVTHETEGRWFTTGDSVVGGGGSRYTEVTSPMSIQFPDIEPGIYEVAVCVGGDISFLDSFLDTSDLRLHAVLATELPDLGRASYRRDALVVEPGRNIRVDFIIAVWPPEGRRPFC